MKILVTGADGFLGSHIRDAAIERGHQVTEIAMYRPEGHTGWATDKAHRGDIGDPFFMKPLMDEADAVINCAALVSVPYSQIMPGAYWRTNATAVATMLMLKPRRFIQISTSEVFDGANPPYRHDSMVCPITPYGASKAAGEAAAQGLGAGFATVVRVFNLFGPRQFPRAVIPLMIRQALEIQEGKRTRAKLYGPLGSRAFLYAPRVAQQVLDILADTRPLVQLASMAVIDIADLWPMVARAVGIDPALVEWTPPPANASPVANLYGHSSPDYPTLLPWPDGIDLEGLAETVTWHRANRHYCAEGAYQ